MPFLAGLISAEPPDVCERLVDRMVATMLHEKFYVVGKHACPELGVYAAWGAHEGSFADGQPAFGRNRDVAVLVSGECFADPAAIARLRAAGHDVEPHNTSWLAHLYEELGQEFFGALNGLFSGLLIDRRERCALLFNDRYGLERLYYHEGKRGFFFASEAKALLRILPESRAYDMDALAEYLHYGCTLEWKSLFRHISLLPGASLWRFDAHRCDKRRYFSPSAWESQASLSASAFESQLEATFSTILQRYFTSPTDIGVSLTGGLDTRMIMACCTELDHLVTYTFAGSHGDTLDVQLASRVAAACDIAHHTLRITDTFFHDFAPLADQTVYITDGSLGICGTHEIHLNRHARDLAPVRLTGNFGSEILRGATTFKPLHLSPELLHPDVRSTLSVQRKNPTHPVSSAAFRDIPWHLFGLLRAAQSQVTVRSPFLDNAVVALAFRLPQHLRQTPEPALNVIRNSHSLLAKIRTDSGLLPASRLSSVLGSLWYRATFKLDYYHTAGLPPRLSGLDDLLRLAPIGNWLLPSHRYLQYRHWFRTQLADYVRDRFTDPQVVTSSLWNHAFVSQIAERHINGERNFLREIEMVVTCATIERLLFSSDIDPTSP